MVDVDPHLVLQHQMLSVWQELISGDSLESNCKVLVTSTVQDAIDTIQQESIDHVLVTGSLHLIGSTMTLLNVPIA